MPSGQSNVAVQVTAPAAPGFVSAVAGNGSAKVSWWAGSANGSPIAGYVITPYLGTVAQAPRTYTSAATSETVNRDSGSTSFEMRNGEGPRQM